MVVAEERKLVRSADRRVGGVCGGLADYYGRPPSLLRAGWVGLTILSAILPGVIVYLILWAALPADPRR